MSLYKMPDACCFKPILLLSEKRDADSHFTVKEPKATRTRSHHAQAAGLQKDKVMASSFFCLANITS